MKNLDYALLLEIYGRILTQKQQGVMELYYWEDLSLGEISQEEGITRQAVRDSIKRSEQLLNSYEEKLGIAEKILEIKDNYNEILSNTQKLRKGYDIKYIDKIEELAQKGSDIL